MYTKFYDNTIVTKFIKQLVAKTNVPFISTWKPGDFAIKGMFYLTNDYIWKCQHTGKPESIDAECDDTHLTYHTSRSENVDKKYFVRVKPYIFGQEYYGITGHYRSNVLGYDAITHFYLGQYLRMMRDIFDLDLMPFYNCFANEYINDVDFTEDGPFIINNSNPVYKVLSVPVKFGKTYMLSIDSNTPVDCSCVLYSTKGLLKDLSTILYKSESITNPYKRFQRTQFKQPIFYTTPSWEQLYSGQVTQSTDVTNTEGITDNSLSQYERYLKLLIKVPRTNTSSIVVIEGDYPVTAAPIEESCNGKNSTWNNEYLKGTTINSTTIKGDWVRPKYFKSIFDQDNSSEILVETYNWRWKHYYPDALSIYPGCKFFESKADLKKFIEVISKDYYSPGQGLQGQIWFNCIDRRTLKNYFIQIQQIVKDIDGSISQITYSQSDLEPLKISSNTHKLLFSPLGLLQVNDGQIYAFSNRLLEYLLQHAINHLDVFGKNIQRIQEYSTSRLNQQKNKSMYTGNYIPGVWDTQLQEYLLELIEKAIIITPKVDLTGYVDKDTESIISRGQEA